MLINLGNALFDGVPFWIGCLFGERSVDDLLEDAEGLRAYQPGFRIIPPLAIAQPLGQTVAGPHARLALTSGRLPAG
jgi:hypothetical protein